jgi:hypothetical protein
MIWKILMKAFWRGNSKQRQYRSVSMVALDDRDDIDDVILLEDCSRETLQQPLLPRNTGKLSPPKLCLVRN